MSFGGGRKREMPGAEARSQPAKILTQDAEATEEHQDAPPEAPRFVKFAMMAFAAAASAWVAYYFVDGATVTDWIARIMAFLLLLSLGAAVSVLTRQSS